MTTYYPRACAELFVALEDYKELPKTPIFPQGFNIPEIKPAKNMDFKTSGLFYNPVVSVHSAVLERANFRVADGLEIKIPYKDAPFDPEIIESAIIKFYLGGVTDNTGQDQEELSPQWRGALSPVGNDSGETNMRFEGPVDTWKSQHDSEGHWIVITARDYTAWFIDAIFPSNANIDLSGALDEVIQSIADMLDLSFDVAFSPDIPADEDPYPGKDFNISAIGSVQEVLELSPKQYGNLATAAIVAPYKEGLSYWDVITQICFSEGFIPHMGGKYGKTILLTRISDVYGAEPNPKHFMWGYNIKSLIMDRKLGKIKTPIVLVSGYAPLKQSKNEQLIFATYPPNALADLQQFYLQQQQGSMTGVKPTAVYDKGTGRLFKAEFYPVTVPHVKSKDALNRIAKNLYHEIGRQALMGKLLTKELTSMDGEDYDVLALHQGDQVRLDVMPRDADYMHGMDELNFIRTQAPDKVINYLTSKGYDKNVAAALAEAITSPLFTVDYFVKNIRYTYEAKSGLQIEIDFSNFIDRGTK